MYHITTETATAENEFTDGSELIPPTDLNALWFNMIQRELLAILSAAGIAPNVNEFNQVWKSIEKFGLKAVYSEDEALNLGGFSGNVAVFHSDSDFAFAASLNRYSFVVIVPTWRAESSDYISVTYNGAVTKVLKNRIFVGIAIHSSDLQLLGVQLPIIKADGAFAVTSLDAAKIKYSECVDDNVVSFVYDENDEPPARWQQWQLKANWKIGQVKKVRCTSASAVRIVIFYGEGVFRQVEFYPGTYREFICTGYTTQGDVEYAILLVNGANY